MATLSSGLIRSVCASLPTTCQSWWRPPPDTAPETQLRLHTLRMAFVRDAMQLLPESPSTLWRAKVLFLPSLQYMAPLRAVQDTMGQQILSRRRGMLTCPEDPPGTTAVAEKIFPHLPTNLSRYMYLSLLHETDEPRFSYPALREHLSEEEMHCAIVTLASRLVWWLCLIDAHHLQLQIRGCIEEMSGGCVKDFSQWCHSSVAQDAPFLAIDHVLRACLVSIMRAMNFPTA